MIRRHLLGSWKPLALTEPCSYQIQEGLIVLDITAESNRIMMAESISLPEPSSDKQHG